MTEKFSELATDETINKTKEALEKNGIAVVVVETGAEAKAKVLEMVPEGAEIMNMTSVTLDSIGLAEAINAPEKTGSVRNKLATMDAKTQGPEMRKMGAAPEWAVGSVHAVTEDGKVFVASASGSQLPAYAYGASHVVWVVGAQKIVKDANEAVERIQNYVFPLENERALKVYGEGSSVNKILIFNKESAKDRITMVIVKEKLGF